MPQCILCGNETKYFRVINRTNIHECKRCRLAITVKNSNNEIFYKKPSSHNLKNYLATVEIQRRKYKKIVGKVVQSLQSGHILEVGAGFGLFSDVLFKTSKFKIDVVEPYLPLFFIKSNRHILKYKIDFETFLRQNKKKYDIVVFMDVIEHFSKPDLILRNTSQIINDFGYVILQVPNYISLMAYICRNWSWWMTEDHKFHFSINSIKNILRISGYEVVHLRTYESYYDFRKNFDGNFDSYKNVILKKIIKAFFYCLFFPLYFIFREVVWFFGYGGLIFVIARKQKT